MPYWEAVFKKLEWNIMGIMMDSEYHNNLSSTYDKILLRDAEEILHRMIKKFHAVKVGLAMIWWKLRYIMFSG